MAISKVVFGNRTLVDLTADSVTPETLAAGATAHAANGKTIVGTAYKNTYYVKGTQTSKTNLWTGNLPEVEDIYEGLTIDYYLPYAGNGNAVTLNLTLKNGTQTGAVNCYTRADIRLTTQIGQYYTCRLVYHTITYNNTEYTGWYVVKSIDIDSLDNAWKELTGANFIGTLKYRKFGNVIQIENDIWIQLTAECAAGNSIILTSLPDEDRYCVLFGMAYKNASSFPILPVRVEDGNIILYNSSSSAITTTTLLNVISMV